MAREERSMSQRGLRPTVEAIGNAGAIEVAYISESVDLHSGQALAMTVHLIYREGDKLTEATILIKPPQSFSLTDRIVRLELRDLVKAIQAAVQSPQSLISRAQTQE